MKYLFVLMIVGIFATMPASAQQTEKPVKPDSATVSYSIKGIACPACGLSVEYSLKRLKGILHYQVDLQKGNARVSYNPAVIQKEKIEKVLKSTGFTISEVKAEEAGKDES